MSVPANGVTPPIDVDSFDTDSFDMDSFDMDSFDTDSAALTALVADGKAEGVIDPALSTEAIVFFYQALSVGACTMSLVHGDSATPPAAHEWNALFARVLRSFGPPPY